MARKRSPNIKDDEIVRMNSLGYSLQTIAESQGCYPSTIKNRLDDLGIACCDTRRSFMEDVCRTLTDQQIQWIASYLGPSYQIKNLVSDLIKSAYIQNEQTK